MKRIYLLLIMILVLNFVGCTKTADIGKEIEGQVVNEDIIENDNEVIQEEVIEEEVIEEEVIEEEVIEEVDMTAIYKEYSVNELGQIIVIMYHNLADKPGAYSTTKELFIKDLERLYDEGYRTISMTDLATNNIDVPLGTTPVVLTFDDASKSNFFYDEEGNVSEDSVVSILDEFSKSHEDFGSNAIFYVYGENPFRERDRIKDKFDYLIEHGYEIGTHTYGHDDLGRLDAAGIQKTLGKNEEFVSKFLENHKMVHLSLPYGHRPSESLEKYLFNGEYDGKSYEIISAVNVGWNPIKSPSHVKFNAKSINRITVGDEKFELDYWLDYFLENPDKKYISDGDANLIVIPENEQENVDEIHLSRVVIYSNEKSE